ncbi:hypothetical protein JOD43_003226 [Pullulanibacillus pueri]|uniref:Uncharacterized protein n=1 Tax=Pullulanibacillus pueri TaxID=1437324 RepID=A0A8J2ZYA7_9BACL|nr:hypothetical protein [Pullulanibacillus pueri]MBM7683047.1 hypothetical protein [Pullulanibacillus pueri]GGH84967.1 hypothetical protein GCM10007096_29260 [Pullulanibacillus pueri]
MSAFITIAIMVVVWAFIGSAKAMKGKKNEEVSHPKPSFGVPLDAREEPGQRLIEREVPYFSSYEDQKKTADFIPDDDPPVLMDEPKEEWVQPTVRRQVGSSPLVSPSKKRKSTAHFKLNQKKMAEAVLLAEVLDRPRALKPFGKDRRISR